MSLYQLPDTQRFVALEHEIARAGHIIDWWTMMEPERAIGTCVACGSDFVYRGEYISGPELSRTCTGDHSKFWKDPGARYHDLRFGWRALGVRVGDIPVWDARSDLDQETCTNDQFRRFDSILHIVGLHAGGIRPYTTPHSLTTYIPLYKLENIAESARIINRLAAHFLQYLYDYQTIRDRNRRSRIVPQGGGLVLHRPVMVVLSNYGGTLVCDSREPVTQYSKRRY